MQRLYTVYTQNVEEKWWCPQEMSFCKDVKFQTLFDMHYLCTC